MNKKYHFTTSLAAIALLAASNLSAATLIEASTSVSGLSDVQGPAASGTLNSASSDTLNGSDFNFSGPATALSSVNSTGQAAVSAEGLYACGPCTFDLTASSLYETSYTNALSSSIDFTFNFFINGPTVEVIDYGYVSQSSGLGAEANANVLMSTTGGASDSFTLSLQLLGGDAGHDIISDGAISTLFITDSGFGYTMNDISGSFSGSLAAGESVTFSSELLASVYGPGFEVGSRAFFGDPNSLTTGAGISSEFIVSAVPVPAAVWLFASGLMGLVGVSLRKRR